MILKLLKNLKSKAIKKIQDREKRMAMINKKYPIIGKVTKRLIVRAQNSVKDKKKKFGILRHKYPFFI
jgi:hypothetical protein